MRFPSGSEKRIRIAAKRAGYYDAEVDRLIRQPKEELRRRETPRLRFSMEAVEAFQKTLAGKEADYRRLVEFGNQLYNIEDPTGKI